MWDAGIRFSGLVEYLGTIFMFNHFEGQSDLVSKRE